MFAAEPYSGQPLYTLGSNKRHELMYNLGVSLLHAGRPIQAFDCLTEAVQVYHMNPRLWLRLAECCVMAHKAVSNMHHLCWLSHCSCLEMCPLSHMEINMPVCRLLWLKSSIILLGNYPHFLNSIHQWKESWISRLAIYCETPTWGFFGNQWIQTLNWGNLTLKLLIWDDWNSV
jgi:hypothetical protein